jgi:hypothetical protein
VARLSRVNAQCRSQVRQKGVEEKDKTLPKGTHRKKEIIMKYVLDYGESGRGAREMEFDTMPTTEDIERLFFFKHIYRAELWIATDDGELIKVIKVII